MLEQANLTIDRHTPTIPESIWFGVTPSEEALQTRIKNTYVVPSLDLPKFEARKLDFPKHKALIREKDLDEAEALLDDFPVTNQLVLDFLHEREVDFELWKPIDPYALAMNLSDGAVDALNLKVHRKI